MAIQRTTVRQFTSIIKKTKSAVLRGHGLAIIAGAEKARELAIKNVKANYQEAKPKAWRQLTGRRLTGQQLKAIRVEIERSRFELPKAFLAVTGIPYGAIHEFGGDITPKRANHLWIKAHYKGVYKRMTPREFMQAKSFGRVGNISYSIFRSKRKKLIAAEVKYFKNRDPKVKTLFVLRDKVTIPERPYLRPAAKEAGAMIPSLSKRFIMEQLEKSKGE